MLNVKERKLEDSEGSVKLLVGQLSAQAHDQSSTPHGAKYLNKQGLETTAHP